MTPNVVVIVAGGTGGHLYPGIATAHALKKGGWEPVFMVRNGDLGKDLLQREGFRVYALPGQGWPRSWSLKRLTFPFNVVGGFTKALHLLGDIRPRVVMGMGGYLSFPVLLAARLRHIPTLIHEQNVFPGLANRLLSRFVQSIAVSFTESQAHFPTSKVWLSGLPVRADIGSVTKEAGRDRFKLSQDRLTLLVFGGSQGAHRINEAVAGAWEVLADRSRSFQVLHVTGEQDYLKIQDRYRNSPVQANVMPYCHDMAAAFAAADWVICRAGASTVVELILAQKPALLIPFPFASENHQFYNAEVLVRRGVADVVVDMDVSPALIADRLQKMASDPGRTEQIRSRLTHMAQESSHIEAAQRLADYITRMS